MAGIFNTLNTSNKGLFAQQTALHTTAHNISNANTDGFSRQRVEMKADLSYTLGSVGQLGTGVKMETVIRVVDDFVNKQIRQESGTLSQYQAKADVLEQMEAMVNEPSEVGLQAHMSQMFEGWQELAKNPESLSSRTIVIEKSRTFADLLNHGMDQTQALIEETDQQIGKQITDLEALVDGLDTLNRQIFNIAVKGHIPNDLLDQRDKLMSSLAEITNFSVGEDSYGRVEISVGTQKLLSFEGKESLEGISWQDTANTGALRGYYDGKAVLETRMAELTDFASVVAQGMNLVHKEGLDPSEALDIFLLDGEGRIFVNPILGDDNSRLMAGETPDSPVGDGTRAAKMAALRDANLLFGEESTTMESKYNAMVTKMGIAKQHADNMVKNQTVLLGQLETRRESISGVSLDEEVSNLVKYQKAYEANAKVIAVLTEMLDVLINRTGV